MVVIFYELLYCLFLVILFLWLIFRLGLAMFRLFYLFQMRSIDIWHIFFEVRWILQFQKVSRLDFLNFILLFLLFLSFLNINMRLILFEILRKVSISQFRHFILRPNQLLFFSLHRLVQSTLWFLSKSPHILSYHLILPNPINLSIIKSHLLKLPLLLCLLNNLQILIMESFGRISLTLNRWFHIDMIDPKSLNILFEDVLLGTTHIQVLCTYFWIFMGVWLFCYLLLLPIIHDFKHNILLHFLFLEQLLLLITFILLHLHPYLGLEILLPLCFAIQIIHLFYIIIIIISKTCCNSKSQL